MVKSKQITTNQKKTTQKQDPYKICKRAKKTSYEKACKMSQYIQQTWKDIDGKTLEKFAKECMVMFYDREFLNMNFSRNINLFKFLTFDEKYPQLKSLKKSWETKCHELIMSHK